MRDGAPWSAQSGTDRTQGRGRLAGQASRETEAFGLPEQLEIAEGNPRKPGATEGEASSLSVHSPRSLVTRTVPSILGDTDRGDLKAFGGKSQPDEPGEMPAAASPGGARIQSPRPVWSQGVVGQAWHFPKTSEGSPPRRQDCGFPLKLKSKQTNKTQQHEVSTSSSSLLTRMKINNLQER